MCNCPGRRGLTDEMRTNAAMCLACPARDGEVCGVTGQPVALHVATSNCAWGGGSRFVDGSGRVRWLGLNWLGVPMPLRWKVTRAAVALGVRVPRLPGCGCLEVGVRLWRSCLRLVAAFTGNMEPVKRWHGSPPPRTGP